jgi:hypothetical protein
MFCKLIVDGEDTSHACGPAGSSSSQNVNQYKPKITAFIWEI